MWNTQESCHLFAFDTISLTLTREGSRKTHDVKPSLRIFLLVFFYALFYAFFMTRPLLFLDPVQCASCGRGRTQNWPWILVWERILKIFWLIDWEVAESLLWPSKADTIGAQWKILKQEAYWEAPWLVGSRDDSLRERIVRAQKLVNEVCCESPRAA